MNQLSFMADATGLIDEMAYHVNVIQSQDVLQRIEKAIIGQNKKTK